MHFTYGDYYADDYLSGLGANFVPSAEEDTPKGTIDTEMLVPRDAPLAQTTWQDVVNNLATIGVQQMNTRQQQQYQLALARVRAGQGNMPVFAPTRSPWSEWLTPVLIGGVVITAIYLLSKRR